MVRSLVKSQALNQAVGSRTSRAPTNNRPAINRRPALTARNRNRAKNHNRARNRNRVNSGSRATRLKPTEKARTTSLAHQRFKAGWREARLREARLCETR